MSAKTTLNLGTAMTQETEMHPTDRDPITLADHGYFFVGGAYVDRDNSSVMTDAMYVEKFIPADQRQPYPVVMFHGGGQTGVNFTGTPDGRRGWAHDFLRAGYAVYVIDQPERGRSGHTSRVIEEDGALLLFDATRTEQRFTAPGKHKLWPQSRHHTQWPGSGEKGDPVFDQFYASQIEGIADGAEVERLNQNAGAALLDKIGPAILLTHSQSGPFGWLIADVRPTLVKAILALEPNGPPFREIVLRGGGEWYVYEDAVGRPGGPTRVPLTFDPPLEEGEALTAELQAPSDNPELVTGYLQASPARQLPNLQNIPIMIMVAEASYHATYDHITSAFLKQAGVDHELAYLADKGFSGNGHMVMLEKNNHAVADMMINWLAGNCR
jgi:pimeloyl-ACP methyl ester carboxylesterase